MAYNSIHSGENIDAVVGSGLKYYDTGTSDTAGRWTVTIPGVAALYEGLAIHVRLTKSYDGTYNTLNVNNLGAKLCWYRRAERLTSHIPQYAEVTFVYRANANNDSGYQYSSYSGGWVLEYQYQDGNNYDRNLMYNQAVTAGANGIYGTQLIMQDANGTWQSITKNRDAGTGSTLNTVGFRPEVIYYYSNSGTISSGSNTATWCLFSELGIDIRYSIKAASITTNKPLYLVGTFNSSDGLFYLDTTTWWAQTLPTTNDNKAYVYVGMAYSTTSVYLASTHPIYIYDVVLGKYTSRPTSIGATSSGVTSVATSGTGLSGGTITSTGTITLNSSANGNRSANQVVLANATGSIQTEKVAVSSGTTTKATMQYNTTEDCIEFIFA